MRTHSQIVRSFGASALARAIRERGVEMRAGTVQRWAERNSIPGEYWAHVVALRATTLEELAGSAAKPLAA